MTSEASRGRRVRSGLSFFFFSAFSGLPPFWRRSGLESSAILGLRQNRSCFLVYKQENFAKNSRQTSKTNIYFYFVVNPFYAGLDAWRQLQAFLEPACRFATGCCCFFMVFWSPFRPRWLLLLAFWRKLSRGHQFSSWRTT